MFNGQSLIAGLGALMEGRKQGIQQTQQMQLADIERSRNEALQLKQLRDQRDQFKLQQDQFGLAQQAEARAKAEADAAADKRQRDARVETRTYINNLLAPLAKTHGEYTAGIKNYRSMIDAANKSGRPLRPDQLKPLYDELSKLKSNYDTQRETMDKIKGQTHPYSIDWGTELAPYISIDENGITAPVRRRIVTPPVESNTGTNVGQVNGVVPGRFPVATNTAPEGGLQNGPARGPNVGFTGVGVDPNFGIGSLPQDNLILPNNGSGSAPMFGAQRGIPISTLPVIQQTLDRDPFEPIAALRKEFVPQAGEISREDLSPEELKIYTDLASELEKERSGTFIPNTKIDDSLAQNAYVPSLAKEWRRHMLDPDYIRQWLRSKNRPELEDLMPHVIDAYTRKMTDRNYIDKDTLTRVLNSVADQRKAVAEREQIEGVRLVNEGKRRQLTYDSNQEKRAAGTYNMSVEQHNYDKTQRAEKEREQRLRNDELTERINALKKPKPTKVVMDERNWHKELNISYANMMANKKDLNDRISDWQSQLNKIKTDERRSAEADQLKRNIALAMKVLPTFAQLSAEWNGTFDVTARKNLLIKYGSKYLSSVSSLPGWEDILVQQEKTSSSGAPNQEQR